MSMIELRKSSTSARGRETGGVWIAGTRGRKVRSPSRAEIADHGGDTMSSAQLRYDWPWPSSQLRRLTKHVRDDAELQPGDPGYADVMLWYNSIAVEVSQIVADHDWSNLLGDRKVEITSRPKTRDTLKDKLRRSPTLQLKSVQDIAGVRFEADMTLSEQDAVARTICKIFQQPLSAIHDLRDGAHSGYRAVHVWLRLPANVEVQIRTSLQGAWANTYESTADLFGRSIRYGELPAVPSARRMVELMHVSSVEHLAGAEAIRDQFENLAADADAGRVVLSVEQRRIITEGRALWDAQISVVQSEMAKVRTAIDAYRSGGGKTL